MGVTFIGNPFDQDAEYDDSDWEMNAVEGWIMPLQEIPFIDEASRVTIDLELAPDDDDEEDESGSIWEESNEDEENSDESYFPEDEDTDDFEYSDNDEEEEDIDYVTFPLPEENCSEPEKASTDSNPNPEESSDTD